MKNFDLDSKARPAIVIEPVAGISSLHLPFCRAASVDIAAVTKHWGKKSWVLHIKVNAADWDVRFEVGFRCFPATGIFLWWKMRADRTLFSAT